MGKPWPCELESDRVQALGAVAAAKSAAADAITRRQIERADEIALGVVACRACLALVDAAAAYRYPPRARWSSRLVAVRELIEARANDGLLAAADAKEAATAGGGFAALVEALADLGYFLRQLVAESNGVAW